MPVRLVLFIAAVAASMGAPPIVSAAANELQAPAVSPGSGTTSTAFSFSVRYEGRFEPTSVVATAGGRTVTLSLASGSPTSGTWTGWSTLPVGTWPVSFRATTARGPVATAVGPTVTVIADAPASSAEDPAPSPTAASLLASPPSEGSAPTGTRSSGEAGIDGASSVDGGDAPDGDAAPADAPPPATDDPAAGPDGNPSGVEDPTDGGGDAAPTVTSGTGADAPGGDGGGDGGGDAASGRPAAEGSEGLPRTDGDALAIEPAGDEVPAKDRHADVDAVVTLVLVVGLAGVAAVAILGTLILLAGARRRSRDRGDPPEPAAEGATAESAERILERRALRRGRTRVAEDPIIAAMGVDAELAARRARRVGRQVIRGTGERPRSRRH